MKKFIVFMTLVLCGINSLCAQSVLSGYRGFWERNRTITVFDLVQYYPEKLPFLRNEIYARYGRPFVNQIYRDYFKSQSWYVEKSDFSDSWLSQNDRTNATFIASLEQSIRHIDEISVMVLRNIEYSGSGVVLTFTSRQELVWKDEDVYYDHYSGNWRSGYTLPWAVVGDWILVYDSDHYGRYDFQVYAYKLDYNSRRITGRAEGSVDYEVMMNLLRSQNRRTPR